MRHFFIFDKSQEMPVINFNPIFLKTSQIPGKWQNIRKN